ncbi:hypothetical protein AVEN_231231-1 [Araneus ventricosus]|uniref:Uncharacterized protein n=1 Tax=Araneus ventricosus TaxID=182803 RepID=A0A4Y2VMS7_ARAVE|nr:hypothetical protein AVEN_231231-1 [Araneus ventricosus]
MISTANGDRGLCLDKTTANSSSMTQWNFNEEKIISAEILYILHAAVNNISFSSFDGISQLFSRMFPKGEEAKGMKLSSRKVAYEISHGLGPYFSAKISMSVTPVARKEPVNKTIGVVKRLTKMLSRCVQQEEMDKILGEWRIYASHEEIKEEWSVEKQPDEDVLQWKNIDAYWGNILCLNDINVGKKRYYHLSKIVKAAPCLSHGQAPVER